MVSGPSTPAPAAVVSAVAGASSVGRIRTGAPSESSMIGSPGALGVEAATSPAGPAVLPAARPSARMAPSPRAPAAAAPAPCRASSAPVVLGTPVSCSTVGPRLPQDRGRLHTRVAPDRDHRLRPDEDDLGARGDLVDHAHGHDADPVVHDHHVGTVRFELRGELRRRGRLSDDVVALAFQDEPEQALPWGSTLGHHDPCAALAHASTVPRSSCSTIEPIPVLIIGRGRHI